MGMIGNYDSYLNIHEPASSEQTPSPTSLPGTDPALSPGQESNEIVSESGITPPPAESLVPNLAVSQSVLEAEAKNKATLGILKQLDKDFAKMGSLTNIQTATEGTQQTTDLVSLGANILSGVNHLQLQNSLQVGNSISSSNSQNYLNGISIGANGAMLAAQAAFLIPKAKEWNRLQNEISEKETELRAYSPGGAQENSSNAADRCEELKREINDLKEVASALANETGIGLLLSGITMTSDSLNIASTIVSAASSSAAASTASEVLNVASAGVGIAGSVLNLGLSAHSLYKVGKEFQNILKETDHLLEKLEEPGLDASVKSVIELRLKALEQQYDNATVEALKNSTSLTCAAIGTGAGIATVGLALTGATTGLAATAVTTAGIVPAVIGVGLLTVGVGYAAYKNRKIIEIKLKQTKEVAKTKVGNVQIKQARSEITKQDRMSGASQDIIKKIQMSTFHQKQVIEQNIHKQENLINKYAIEKADPKNADPKIQEKLNNQMQAEFKIMKDLYQDLKSLERTAQSQINAKVEQLGQAQNKTNTLSKKVFTLQSQVKISKTKSEMLKVNGRVQKLSQNFAHTTPDQLQETAASWVKTFNQSPESVQAVNDFMRSEGYVTTDFEDNSISHIFGYLTQDAKAA